jgi:hypothetical protein
VRYPDVVSLSSTKVGRPIASAMRAALRQPASRPTVAKPPRIRPALAPRPEIAQLSSISGTNTVTAPGLTPIERGTLEVGFAVVMMALCAGLQLGQWPAWSAIVALAAYLFWVIAYSETTVQVARFHARRQGSGEARPGERHSGWKRARSSGAAVAPADEQVPA